MFTLIFLIFICLGVFCWLVWILRRNRVSLGLPVAYLFSLLLIHVPGAIAHIVGDDVLGNSDLTEMGMRFATIGTICFGAGVWLARLSKTEVTEYRRSDREHFWVFCLFAGWVFTYGLSFLRAIPTLGATIDKGGAVWMLGVMLGLRAAMMCSDRKWVGIWLTALMVYPVLMLLLGGFLSYGTMSTVIVLSVLVISIRSHWRVAAGVIVAAVLGFNLFLSYFQQRDEIREAVWGGAPMEVRIDASMNIFRDFEWFDPSNEKHLISLDARLNQNYFVGLAATRIRNGDVDSLYGRSLWEGLLSLVPRILWPDKPVFGGSPAIVAEMTGLILSETTSWGVGNVMEFYINFGIPGVVIGFLLLGWLIGMLDQTAAIADADGDFGRLLLFFLPAVAMIQPNGSLVELTGGSAAALVAAHGWKWAWLFWVKRRGHPAMVPTVQ
jgi:putative effector of murein hydrolase LrgA (UPF0299 family)